MKQLNSTNSSAKKRGQYEEEKLPVLPAPVVLTRSASRKTECALVVRSKTPIISPSKIKGETSEDCFSSENEDDNKENRDLDEEGNSELDEEHSLSEESAEDEDSTFEDEEDSEKEKYEVGTRRSSRIKESSYNKSWIVGGGPDARGYPSRRSTRKSYEYREEPSLEQSERSEPQEDSSRLRRTTRRSVAFEDKERDANHTNSKDKDDEKSDEEVEHDDNTNSTTGDLYSRLKSRTSRKNYNEKVLSQSHSNSNQETPAYSDHSGRSLRRTAARTASSARRPQRFQDEPIRSRLRDRSKTKRPQLYIGGQRNIEDLLRRKRKSNFMDMNFGSSSSSSSSDSEQESRQKSPKKKNRYSGMTAFEKSSSKKALSGDFHSIEVDPSVTFESVGGLSKYIDKLKEVVVFPMMYKEFFVNRNITPPRGIIFHGPPGTGKTLLARALAAECSMIGSKKVSFYMRKGADILNKWVGESERHLKLLFEQAAKNQPSIIFFDEIDGLAPVRSSKTDQIHNSIVSTFLAELDGLKDRGEVIVIGATNRIDSVDPALRRPGRFDYEFEFFLPSLEGRKDIIKVHLSKNDSENEILSNGQLDALANACVGFSGADLKFLCAEANMCALKRKYPQIYSSKQKLLIDYKSIRIEHVDIENAMKSVSRSMERSIFSVKSPAAPLPLCMEPLLKSAVEQGIEMLEKVFPYKLNTLKEPGSKRCILIAQNLESCIDSFIVPAILNSVEAIPVNTISLETISLKDAYGDAAAVTQIIAESLRHPNGSILYIPSIGQLWKVLSPMAQEILKKQIVQNVTSPLLFLATTSQDDFHIIDQDIANFFNQYKLYVQNPSDEEREAFFEPIFSKHALYVKYQPVQVMNEELPIAPPEPEPEPTAQEIAEIEKEENIIMRELRVFLRQIISKLAKDRKFTEFTKPVDLEEVPDYYDCVKEPMDLETMMCKLDQGEYFSAKQFLDDIALITTNALSYNPCTTDQDKRIRHRANELRDMAHLYIDLEMDPNFEKNCQRIVKAREERENKKKAKKSTPVVKSIVSLPPSAASTPIAQNSRVRKSVAIETVQNNVSGPKKSPVTLKVTRKKKRKSWNRKSVPKKAKFDIKTEKLPSAEEDNDATNEYSNSASETQNVLNNMEFDTEKVTIEDPFANDKEIVLGHVDEPNMPNGGIDFIEIDTEAIQCESGFIFCNSREKYADRLKKIELSLLVATIDCSVVQLTQIRFHLLKACEEHYLTHDKIGLIEIMEVIISDFLKC